MTALYLAATLKQLEAEYAQRQPSLIAQAGQVIAQWLLVHQRGKHFGILIGPGNNGADAVVCAQHLVDAGQHVRLITDLSPPTLEPFQAPRARLGTLAALQGRMADLAECDIIVDGLFGSGLNRPLDSTLIAALQHIDQLGKAIVAIDIPSGLNGDLGIPLPYALHATHTLSLLGRKPGYYTAEGRDHCGHIHHFDLLAGNGSYPPADLQLIDTLSPHPQLIRKHASHKGSHGTLAIYGGSAGMAGAALLAGRMAAKAGAGKVYLGMLDPALGVDLIQPELMLRAGIKLVDQPDINVAAIGPGLGQSDVAADLLGRLLDSKLPLLLDADALNLLAQSPTLQRRLQHRQAPSIITPHPAEAARLLGVETRQVQQDRLTAAQQLIAQFHCTIALKGSGTICGNEQGLSINASGNGALAAAGQGDVLSGLIAALLVQGLAPLEAAQRGVFVHGVTADEWRCTHPNGLGLCASELIDPIRFILNR